MWKNRAAWLAMTLAALGLYLFENNTGTRVLLTALLCAPPVSALWLYVPRRNVSAAFTLPETLRRSETAEGALTLENRDALPVGQVLAEVSVSNLLTGERAGLSLSGALRGRGTRAFPLTLGAAHCGAVEIRLERLALTDALGLFTRKLSVSAVGTVLVPPELSPVTVTLADAADFLTDAERYSLEKPGYDPGETFRVREYVPGDALRQIHWKLSLKSDALLVRDFGLPVVDRLLLLLETSSRKGLPLTAADMDAMLDLLFSLSAELLSMEISHTVGWQRDGNYASQEIVSADDLAALRETLLRCPIGVGETTVAGTYAQSHAECGYAHVALISPGLPPDTERLFHGNRVTVLLTDGAEPGLAPGAEVVLFSEETLRGGTLCLDL